MGQNKSREDFREAEPCPRGATVHTLTLMTHPGKAVIIDEGNRGVFSGHRYEFLTIGPIAQGLRVIFDGTYIRREDDYLQVFDICRGVYEVNTSVVNYFFHGGDNQKFCLNANCTISPECCHWLVLGLHEQKLALVGATNPNKLLFCNEGWPITGLQNFSSDMLSFPLILSSHRNKGLCLSNKMEKFSDHKILYPTLGSKKDAIAVRIDGTFLRLEDESQLFALEVVAGSYIPETKLVLFNHHRSMNQRFLLNANGTISCYSAPWLVLGEGPEGAVQLVGASNDNKFVFEYDHSWSVTGLLKIPIHLPRIKLTLSSHSNLGIKYASRTDESLGMKVKFFEIGTAKESVTVVFMGDTLRIVDDDEYYALDCARCEYAPNTEVVAFYCHGGPNQKFVLNDDHTISPRENSDVILGLDRTLVLVQKDDYKRKLVFAWDEMFCEDSLELQFEEDFEVIHPSEHKDGFVFVENPFH